MATALLDAHLLVSDAFRKVGLQPSGPQQRDSPPSRASISGSSTVTDDPRGAPFDRTPSGHSVTFRELADVPHLRRTRSGTSSNGASTSGATPLSRSRSFHSNTPSHRRAATTWDFREYPADPDDYELLEELGKGATATVYLAYNRTHNTEVALKIVNLDDDTTCNLDAIINEVKIMKLQHHPAVLPLYAAFLVEDQLWMVLPYIAGGSAQDILKRQNDGQGLTEHVIAVIMRDVLSALAYLHKDGIIHRDLKAANILIDQAGKVILADLGVTCQMHRNFSMSRAAEGREGTLAYLSRTTFAGTPCWMAPEVMEEDIGYDCAADIWSFGMTLVELATGSAPYAALSLDQILIKTMNDDPPQLESNDRRKRFTEALQDLVAQCLQKDPQERPSAERLLKHKFFKNSYDSRYLAERLDIGSGAALTHGVKRNPLRRAKSSLAIIAHKIDDKHCKWAPFEVDVTDAMTLLRRLSMPPAWLPDNSEPLDLRLVYNGKGLAFAMLKRSGKGIVHFKGTGFVIAKTTNSRRETEWSAPSYFDMTVYGLGPPFRDMKELDVAMVLPNDEAVDAMQQDVFEVGTGSIPEDGPLPPGSPPRASFKTPSKFKHFSKMFSKKGGAACRSVGREPVEKLAFGWGVERGGEQPLRVPLTGARMTVSCKMNAKMYGPEAPPPSEIMNFRKTKRPPPFERLVADLELMLEGARPTADMEKDANFMKAMPYYFQ